MSDVKNIKVVINLGDSEFTLTTEQARELRDILDNLLGPKYHYYPYYTYPQVWYSGNWEVKSNSGFITYADGSKEYFPQGDSIQQQTYTITLK